MGSNPTLSAIESSLREISGFAPSTAIAYLLGSKPGDDDAAEDDPLLATLMDASIQSRIATGPEAGQRWRRLGDPVEPADEDFAVEPPPCCVREGGMSLHAGVAPYPHGTASASSASSACKGKKREYKKAAKAEKKGKTGSTEPTPVEPAATTPAAAPLPDVRTALVE